MAKIVLSGRDKVAKPLCSLLYHVLSNLNSSGVGLFNMIMVWFI